ncbi:MAG: glyceraldehyde-3-phosphate dehydrogenase [Chitinophagales bacterium]
MTDTYQTELNKWIAKEKLAMELMHVVSGLWLDHSIELIIFRRKIIDNSVSTILNDHLYARRYINLPLSIDISLKLAKAIREIGEQLAPSKIDLGKLSAEWLEEKDQYNSEKEFIADKLKNLGNGNFKLQPKDVVLYGFGRIGRLAARILIAEAGKGEQLRLKAIVTRSNSDEDILKRANLLRKDSIHGKMAGTIIEDLEQKTLVINGQRVHMIAANDPSEIDYTKYEINNALLIDNTGVWRDRAGLGQHLKSKGIEKVLFTAPGKDLPDIVYGVNNEVAENRDENIYTAASCTTNCIAPVLKVIEDEIGIEKGHVETVHSYTNDQNLLDNYHKKYRRGKSAPLNMVITSTGAAKAVAKVLPVLKGKLTGNAVRVPTPNVSLAILNLELKQNTSKEAINQLLRKASMEGDLVEQIDFSTSNELVSTDVVGNPHAAVVDSPSTIVSEDGKNIVLYAWYDNEYGYTRQVIRLAKLIAGVIRLRYY